jgi:hypothetical protein
MQVYRTRLITIAGNCIAFDGLVQPNPLVVPCHSHKYRLI